MTLLNPLLLWMGVASVSVPIIIHLLNKRKFERVSWAAMRFLRISVEQNQRRIQIEDILLLILRCLLLLLLGLALSRPALRAAEAAGLLGKRAAVIGCVVLDNSYSMSCTDGVHSRFDEAKEAGAQVLQTMSNDSSVAVILASDVADRVIPEPSSDLEAVRKEIRKAKLSDRSTNLAAGIRAAIDTLNGRPSVRKEIYVLTDGQALGFRQMSDIKRMIDDASKPGQDVKTHIILVGSHETQNLGVSSLRMTSELAAVGQPLRCEVEVSNYGSVDAHDVEVNLHVDSDDPSDKAVIDMIGPGASKTVPLFVKLREAGFHTVTATLPPDHLPADDTRTIALRAVTQTRVLLVDGDPGHTARENETFFLRNLLEPVAPTEEEKYFVKTTVIGGSELDTVKLADYDAVVLADVADFSPAVLEQMAAYMRQGRGGLMIFPGPHTLVDFYNRELLGKYHFLPASLGPARGSADQAATYFTLQDKAFEHPIASVWSDPAAGTPAAAHFYRAYQLIPDPMEIKKTDEEANGEASKVPAPDPSSPEGLAAEAGVARVVLRYAHGTSDGSLDDQPAVMERDWGQGRVVLFSSTASTKWNDLGGHPGVFMPLVHRSLAWVVGRQNEGLNMLAGTQKFTYRLGDEYAGHEATIYAPGEGENVEVRRVEQVNGVPTLTYDKTDVAGEYKVVIADPPTTIKFAVQRDPAESSLDELSGDQKKSLGEVADVVQWKTGDDLKDTIARQRVGTELWLPLAFLVVLLATAETLAAHWFSRIK